MSFYERLSVEAFRTFRIFLLGVALVSAARELATHGARANKVVADFNREQIEASVGELQRLFPRQGKQE